MLFTARKITKDLEEELKHINTYDCTNCRNEDKAICNECNSLELFLRFRFSEKPTKFEMKKKKK